METIPSRRNFNFYDATQKHVDQSQRYPLHTYDEDCIFQHHHAWSTNCHNVLNGTRHSTLTIPISESGTNSSHTHNLVKSQSYRGLRLLLSDTKFMTTINSMLIYHTFQENESVLVINAQPHACQWLVPSVVTLHANSRYSMWIVQSAKMNNAS